MSITKTMIKAAEKILQEYHFDGFSITNRDQIFTIDRDSSRDSYTVLETGVYSKEGFIDFSVAFSEGSVVEVRAYHYESPNVNIGKPDQSLSRYDINMPYIVSTDLTKNFDVNCIDFNRLKDSEIIINKNLDSFDEFARIVDYVYSEIKPFFPNLSLIMDNGFSIDHKKQVRIGDLSLSSTLEHLVGQAYFKKNLVDILFISEKIFIPVFLKQKSIDPIMGFNFDYSKKRADWVANLTGLNSLEQEEKVIRAHILDDVNRMEYVNSLKMDEITTQVELDIGHDVIKIDVKVDANPMDGTFVIYHENGEEADNLHEDEEIMKYIQEIVDEYRVDFLDDLNFLMHEWYEKGLSNSNAHQLLVSKINQIEANMKQQMNQTM